MESASRYGARLAHVLSFLLAATMLVACSTVEETTPETTAALPDADVIVSFDGAPCVSTGEPLLSEGGLRIHYDNRTDGDMQFSVLWSTRS